MSKIEPKILKGTRDFLPTEMAKRRTVENKIIKVFRRFGYDEIDTPAIEYAETLLGKYGDESSKLLYRFPDNGGRDIALRYDQTVPFARVVAGSYNELPMPFKRYQISKVWRADKPAKGRFREFTQCDVDIVGTDNLTADAEIAAVISAVFQELGITNIKIKINSRKLMNNIFDKLNIAESIRSAVIRELDKLEKIGKELVEAELLKLLPASTVANLLNLMLLTGTNDEKLKKLQDYDTAELSEFLELTRQFDVPNEQLIFEPSLARGLDYYTGIIFEAFSASAPLGSLCGGGRYADLCGLFSDKRLSGVGVAFGFDRIILALEALGLLQNTRLATTALITYFSPASLPASLSALTTLQTAGFNAEIYFEPVKLEKQFKFANKKQIPFVIICGEDEIKNGTITVKNMTSGKQKTIPQNQLALYFQGNTAV